MREQFTTFFADGAPRQIEIGLENALARLNGNPIESVRVDLIGDGDSRVRATSGDIPLATNLTRRSFYKHCRDRAKDDLQSKKGGGL